MAALRRDLLTRTTRERMVGQPAPDEPSQLIGRERELAVVKRRLATSRLVTIAGLGGVGKTSLAYALAAQRTAAGGPTILVDLAPVLGRRGVLDAIATAVGAGDAADRDLVEAIGTALATSPSLLVLDNFEHVLDAASDVGALLELAPGLRVLATSRVPLGLPAESTVPLGSLGLPTSASDVELAPASALFLVRARERSRAPALQPEDAAAVVEICRRLDGLPLAIELAAAWSGILTPRAILLRLATDRLDLTGDDPRHASLEAVVESTLALVDRPGRDVFPLLGVFAGPFDEPAARAVTGKPDILGALRALERAALVRVDADAVGEPRFELLETIRAVALRDLRVAGRLDEALRRHAIEYSDRAVAAADTVRTRSFSGRGAGAALADPNIQAAFERSMALPEAELAVRLAAALATRAMQTGILRDALARLRSAMALTGVSAGVLADGLNALVSVRGALREAGDQLADATEAVALARAAGSPVRVVRTLITLGNVSEAEDARSSAYADAAELAENVDYAWGAATARGSLADLDWLAGRTIEAIAHMQQAEDASARQGDLSGVGNWLTARAEYELNIGRVADGLAHLEEAAAILRDNPGLPFFVTTTQTLLASGQALAGQAGAAYRTLADAARRVEMAEAVHDIEDWLGAAATVLLPRHPIAAARCLGALDRIVADSGGRPVSERLHAQAARRIEGAIGRNRLDRERATGSAADRRVLFDELARLVRREAGPDPSELQVPYGALTARERQILARLAEGRTDREIAEELGITAKTASVHVANIKAKLGVLTRVEAVLFARDRLGGRP